MRWSCAWLAVALAFGRPQSAWANDDAATIAQLDVEGQANEAHVVVRGSFAVPEYTVHSADRDTVVSLVLPGIRATVDQVLVMGSSPLVRDALIEPGTRGATVRLLLNSAVSYRVHTESGALHLFLEAHSKVSELPAAPQEPPLRLEEALLLGESDPARQRLELVLNAQTEFRMLPEYEGRLRLEIPGARVSSQVAEQLEVPKAGVLESVAVRQRPTGVLVEVRPKPHTSATPLWEGERLVWLFHGEKSHPVAGAGQRARTVARESELFSEPEEAAGFFSDAPAQLRAAKGGRRGYRGRRIDLDFKDADIHNILRLLADVGDVNVVTADDVSGQVTIKMKDVPWDQALDVILAAKGLGMVRRDNLIRVAPQETLEKERELAIERRKQKIELAPLETRIVPVSYAGASGLALRVREILSERGKVSVDERTNVLLVVDVAEALDNVEELVRSLDTQTPQVLIEARIVEASTSFSNDFGIQWGGSAIFSSATGNPTGLTFPSDATFAGGASDSSQPTAGLSPFSTTVPNPNFVVNLPAPVGTGSGGAIGMSLGSLAGNFNLSLRLSAFESNGQVRIISSPRILTLDNYQATIQQGTSIPYSQVSAQGVQTAFQEATLRLQVTPHVTSDGAVSMEVNIQRDEPDFNQTSARGDPTILKRSADTSLLVHDGHTAVIGGIYTRNTGRGIDQVPFFGDIPILGVLFQHRTHSDSRNELLIFLTPRVVNRMESSVQ